MKSLIALGLAIACLAQSVFAQATTQTSEADTTDIMGGSTPGGEQRGQPTAVENEEIRSKKSSRVKGQLNSAQKMEERKNNAGVIIESPKKTKSDGRDFDESRNDIEEDIHQKNKRR